jgi:hypothetical protein
MQIGFLMNEYYSPANTSKKRKGVVGTRRRLIRSSPPRGSDEPPLYRGNPKKVDTFFSSSWF